MLSFQLHKLVIHGILEIDKKKATSTFWVHKNKADDYHELTDPF